MQPDLALSTSTPEELDAARQGWREVLVLLVLGTLALLLVTFREWIEMVHQWWNIETYTHILLVPPIIAWLVSLKLAELEHIGPRPWLPGFALVAAGLALWLAGRASGINLLAHAGAVGAVQGLVVAAIGPRASLVLALPIGFAVFLVPFGDEIIPPLQTITAEIAVALTHWSGIPASVDGIFIDTPVGLFIVAEACSGVKFLVAMVTLAVLVAYTRFDSWTRRAAFLAVSIVVPIIANGVRAWGTIYIAQSQGVEFAAGFDHIFYGWIFFAVVVALVLAAAWRFFERDPQDFGWSPDDVEKFTFLGVIERPTTSPSVAIAALLALLIPAALVATIVGQPAIG